MEEKLTEKDFCCMLSAQWHLIVFVNICQQTTILHGKELTLQLAGNVW